MKNVFVIVQDHQTRVDLRDQLERQGYLVHSAASRADADFLLSSGIGPDLIILDTENPHLHPREFLVAVRSSPKLGKVPLIQICAGAPLDDKHTIAQLGRPLDVSRVLWSLSSLGIEQLKEASEGSRSKSKSS